MKIAIIGPVFFGYLARLAELLSARGYSAHFYDEFPSNKIIPKITLRYASLALRQRLAKDYHAKITEDILRSGATHVLFGTIEMFSIENIQKLKDAGLTLCRYAWDSIENKPYNKKIDVLLERVASFDPNDCVKHGYSYIPLYSSMPLPVPEAPDIDFTYCATLHSNRPIVIKEVLDAARREPWRLELMLFFHSRPLWYLRNIMRPHVWGIGKSISTKPFSLGQIASVTARSKVVIDIHHSGQSGLTMRTFEALSLGATVLTTNRTSVNGLPDELRKRIVLLDRDAVGRSMEYALTRPREALPADLRYYLSADRFVDQIIQLLLGSAEVAQARDVPPQINACGTDT